MNVRMRPTLVFALVVVVAVCCGVAVARYCPGCIDRSRINKGCEWIGDTAFPIDWTTPTHRQHLVADTQLAEDLAIRRADAEFDRLYGYEAHGGLIDNRRVVNECMARLVSLIEANHGVTAEQVASARGQRSALFDVMTALSFLPVYVWGSLIACRRLQRRFADEPRHIQLIAFGLTATVATVLALQAGPLWGAIWETVRVRNGHMSSFRSASDTRWVLQHVGTVCVCGLLVFAVVARFCERTTGLDLVRRAVLFTATMLAAMFADVFVRHAVGYVLLVGALAAFLRVVWSALTPPQPIISTTPTAR
jgi:hypothetical protein